VQSSHSLIDFVITYPAESRQWHNDSNHLCQLAAKDEYSLEVISQKAKELGMKVVKFYEPDLDNCLTAIALEPSQQARKLVQKLPLMLKEVLNEKET